MRIIVYIYIYILCNIWLSACVTYLCLGTSFQRMAMQLPRFFFLIFILAPEKIPVPVRQPKFARSHSFSLIQTINSL